MWWLIALVVLLIVVIYIRTKNKLNHWKRKGVKYEEPHLFIGNLSLFGNKSMFDKLLDLYKKFSTERYFGLYAFMDPTLIVKDPELIKQMGIKDFDHFTDHVPVVDPEMDPVWARNLFALNGNRWREMRATLSPSFTTSKMKIMFVLIDECAKNFTKYFEENISTSEEYEMKDIFTRYTNDVVASAAFGLKVDSIRNKKNDFYMTGRELTNFQGINAVKFFLFFVSPFLTRLLRIRIVSKKVEAYFTNIIKDTVETRQKENIVRPDMIQLLIEAMKGRVQDEEILNLNQEFSSVEAVDSKSTKKIKLTIDDLISQAFIFFLAGFDNVSTLLSFLFYELAVNPDIQQRLREEISKTATDEITYEKLLSIKYLDMVVSETLRLWPPVPFLDRKVTKRFTIEPKNSDESRLVLEAGSYCWFPSMCLQRDANYFPEPNRFDPERFNDQNKLKINPMTYMPFGIGPRSCIGSRFALLETKLLTYHILRKFEVVVVKRTPIPMELHPNDLNLSPKDGMWLGFKKLEL